MTFDAIGIAATGLTTHRKWLDAVSDNLANANNVSSTDGAAFQARYVVAQEGREGSGVHVTGVEYGDAEGRMVYQPDHALADAEGYVRYPDIDLSEQMGNLILAQRGYEANAAVVDRAKSTYEAALQIGRS
ncbi:MULTISPECIES: flagellar basal body rod protein FlgC [unclassified Arthrobacter]|uniref:flagellar basal body rod protein FlgC n=1 Tax=unclassified Arthrobacter TaxID=235627 RepID=UPI001D15B773|nr:MULTISPECIES: flagellar basal body rod protein FlgC [unclassified Arthrobacter]MCC3292309.1 flagellar basal body rod protein FlgC [Arthrobacter sp. zg-Y1110]MCC3302606.1 flagellar basal body rod protein FlgC [Arthrobacter sp. zg-Y895]MCQ1948265.1 flagellar basal body rod protein FlgC [Arthrobacter sp. zg-Y1116]MCQ1988078.1 flagellar basal body rod protein FlgC [Arthrobacter sp. zg-Y844]MCQ1996642.1 flagellar basal body rod protein FlgC [Arthrobacter sp. zg-Y1171]